MTLRNAWRLLPRDSLALGLFVLLLALAMRGYVVYELSRNPFFYNPIVDAQTYDDLAQSILRDGLTGTEIFWQAPLYPYCLAFLYGLFGRRLLMVRIVQILLGSLTAVLTARLAGRLWGSGGALAGIFAACYGTIIFMDTELLAPPLILFLTALIARTALDVRDRPRPATAWILGCLTGINTLAHGPALLMLPAFVVWCLWETEIGSAALRRKLASRIALGGLLVVAFVTARNVAVGGELVLISSNIGINLFIGNSPDYDQLVQIRPGIRWQKLGQEPQLHGFIQPGEQSAYFVRKAAAAILDDPAGWISLLLHKARLLINGHEILRNQDIYPFRGYSRLLALLLWKRGIAFPFGVMFPCAVAGIALLSRRQIRRTAPLLIMIGCLTAGTLLFFITARYRLPIVLLLLPFAAHGAWTLFRPQRLAPARLAAGLAAAVVAAIAANSGIGPMTTTYTADSYFNLATIEEKQGHTNQAIALYRQAVAIDPGYVEAHNNLGVIYDEVFGDPAAALTYFDNVLRLIPDEVSSLLNRGNALYKLGRRDESIRAYLDVLKVRPGSWDARHNLNVVLRSQSAGEVVGPGAERPAGAPDPASLLNRARELEREGALEAAREAYEEALRFAPEDAVSHHNLAVMHFKLGDLGRAETEADIALALAPDLVEARNTLGVIVGARGDYQRAKQLFEQVLRLRPGDAKALANLEHLNSLDATVR